MQQSSRATRRFPSAIPSFGRTAAWRSWCLALLALAALALAGCDSDGKSDLPTEEELVGLWINEDAGTIRAFEFVAPSNYTLYFYASGSEATVQQRGTYDIDKKQLVTHVTNAPGDPDEAGQTYGNAILEWTGESFTIASTSAATGRRTFTRNSVLP